jgi:hypothetical protein
MSGSLDNLLGKTESGFRQCTSTGGKLIFMIICSTEVFLFLPEVTKNGNRSTSSAQVFTEEMALFLYVKSNE